MKTNNLCNNHVADAIRNYYDNNVVDPRFNESDIKFLDSKKEQYKSDPDNTIGTLVMDLIYDEITNYNCNLPQNEMFQDYTDIIYNKFYEYEQKNEEMTEEEYDMIEEECANEIAKELSYEGRVNDIIGSLVCFNADPFIVENDEQAKDVLKFIDNSHVELVFQADDIEFYDTCLKLGLQVDEDDYYDVNELYASASFKIIELRRCDDNNALAMYIVYPDDWKILSFPLDLLTSINRYFDGGKLDEPILEKYSRVMKIINYWKERWQDIEHPEKEEQDLTSDEIYINSQVLQDVLKELSIVW